MFAIDALLREALRHRTSRESLLAADRSRAAHLYDCDDIDALRKQAADLGISTDAVGEVRKLAR